MNSPCTQDAVDCLHCGIEVDVILMSSDGLRFGAHRKNLEVYSLGFPPASAVIQRSEETSSDDAIVKMSENCEVVRLLLQFMHLTTQPDLKCITFNVLDQLANAVEKYRVYSAMQVCKLRMEAELHDHPLEVLRYAIKNNYLELANEAAPLTLKIQFVCVEGAFEAHSLIPYHWLKYWSSWMSVVAFVHERPSGVTHIIEWGGCRGFGPVHSAVRLCLGVQPTSLLDIGNIIDAEKDKMKPCTLCYANLMGWKKSIQNRIDKIGSFSSFFLRSR